MSASEHFRDVDLAPIEHDVGVRAQVLDGGVAKPCRGLDRRDAGRAGLPVEEWAVGALQRAARDLARVAQRTGSETVHTRAK